MMDSIQILVQGNSKSKGEVMGTGCGVCGEEKQRNDRSPTLIRGYL